MSTTDATPLQIDWINVYDTDAAPGPTTPPKLRHFALDAEHVRRPRLPLHDEHESRRAVQRRLHAPRSTPGPQQRARRDHRSSSDRHRRVDPVTVTLRHDRAAAPNEANVTGTITINPERGRTGEPDRARRTTRRSGRTYLRVDWHQMTAGRSRRTGNCSGRQRRAAATFAGRAPCLGERPSIRQPVRRTSPIRSTRRPLVADAPERRRADANSCAAARPDRAFTISFTHTRRSTRQHIVDRPRLGAGERATGRRRSDCGQGSGGASALRNAIRTAAPRASPDQHSVRDSCSPVRRWPEPAPGTASSSSTGNKTVDRGRALEDRFACTREQLGTLASPANLLDGDPRCAYIFLTGFGRTYPAPSQRLAADRGVPARLRHGLGQAPNDGEPCGGANDRPAARLRRQRRAALGPPRRRRSRSTDDVIPGDRRRAISTVDDHHVQARPRPVS